MIDITKFEQVNKIAKGEITKFLKSQFPKFSKEKLSSARHSEDTGLCLTPEAEKLLIDKYSQQTAEEKYQEALQEILQICITALKKKDWE